MGSVDLLMCGFLISGITRDLLTGASHPPPGNAPFCSWVRTGGTVPYTASLIHLKEDDLIPQNVP